jgi:hypothetical protein
MGVAVTIECPVPGVRRRQCYDGTVQTWWRTAPYFHNGTSPTLEAVVQTYNTRQSLGLTAAQIADLAQYLKSL